MSAMWISGHVYNLGEFDEQYKSHTIVCLASFRVRRTQLLVTGHNAPPNHHRGIPVTVTIKIDHPLHCTSLADPSTMHWRA